MYEKKSLAGSRTCSGWHRDRGSNMYRAPKPLPLRNPRWERKKSHSLQTYDCERTARTYVLIFDGKVRDLSPWGINRTETRWKRKCWETEEKANFE